MAAMTQWFWRFAPIHRSVVDNSSNLFAELLEKCRFINRRFTTLSQNDCSCELAL